jgi:uncharacterized protein with PIN domain
VVDSSALIAILLKEPEKQAFEDAIADSDRCVVSAVNAHETATVLRLRHGPAAVEKLWLFLADSEIEIVPFDEAQVREAATALNRYGKGSIPRRAAILIPRFVRHIYDLHMMRDLVDVNEVAKLARAIAETDAQEFHNQYPAYAADITGETGKALAALRAHPAYRTRYNAFVIAMAYGEKPEFETALGAVDDLASLIWEN